MLLAVALALLLVQGLGAILIYRSQQDRRDAALIHTAAMRLLPVARGNVALIDEDSPITRQRPRGMRLQLAESVPLVPADLRDEDGEAELRRVLGEQGIEFDAVMVIHRRFADDLPAQRRLEQREKLRPDKLLVRPERVMLAAVKLDDQPRWLVARVMVPRAGLRPALTVIAQTLLLYAMLVGVIAFILGRLTKPLQALTARVEHFATTRDTGGQIAPQGPDDVRRLIVAQNAMENRIASLLDEKDVMLGAIGHDLKTPLAALRVRIESVEDDSERAKMAATIEDITRSLDDILSLARVGRPSDPLEPAELSALVMQVADEFEDLGEPVVFEPGERIVLPLRPTWVRRALRNLISNALRYGQAARIGLEREQGMAVIRIDDDGPGIPDEDIARMQQPFTRGDPSRNSATGGAGLGLTLARAIAQQHGGSLELGNRRSEAGANAGLRVTLRLPLT
jgi:signal transduction histidine kinase